jgi:hypothetical protein
MLGVAVCVVVCQRVKVCDGLIVWATNAECNAVSDPLGEQLCDSNGVWVSEEVRVWDSVRVWVWLLLCDATISSKDRVDNWVGDLEPLEDILGV